MKTFILMTALAGMVVSGSAMAADLRPCEAIDGPSQFSDLFQNSTAVSVLDVGDVVKEKGANRCSVLIDTSVGRIQYFFTTLLSVRGDTLVKRLSFKVPE